jgi:4'-phosphopantetheinyl transferase
MVAGGIETDVRPMTGLESAVRQIPAPAPFEVWLVDLRHEGLRADLATLSSGERERAARFVFDHHRARYVAAHSALRRLISAYAGLPPTAIDFDEGPFGKPRLKNAVCSFNLSHSDDIAAIALAPDGEVGVDVEVLRPMPDAMDLAATLYTVRERAELVAAGALERDLTFLSCWTRKEACLKAIGAGLQIPPQSFETGTTSDSRTVTIDRAPTHAHVKVCSFRFAADSVGALAWVLPQQTSA